MSLVSNDPLHIIKPAFYTLICNSNMIKITSFLVLLLVGEVCAHERSDLRRTESNRIVNGQEAEVGVYPWFVEGRGWGGVLVSPEFVLTAAHCEYSTFQNLNEGKGMQIGAFCKEDDNCGQPYEFRIPTESFEHPNYDSGPGGYDFLLIKLVKPSTITPVPMDLGELSLNEGNEMLVII